MVRSALVFTFSLPLTAGCDPEGPGASGIVEFASPPTAEERFLRVRQYPVGAEAVPVQYGSGGAERGGCDSYISTISVAAAPSPMPFSTWSGIGVCGQREWAAVAWLSNTEAAMGPSPGERFGVTTFDLDRCGPLGGFCGQTKGVRIVIDDRWP